MAHIFILGGTTFDHIVALPEFPKPLPQTIHQAAFHEATGSTGAGKSLCLTKLGVSNTLYSVLGNDEYGKQIVNYLEKEKVDFVYDIDPKGTERHFNMMDVQGIRISIFITQSSEVLNFSFDKIEAAIQQSDLLVLNILSYCKQFIPLIKKYKKPVWTDLHDYTDGNSYHEPFIAISDYIFLSSDNLPDYKRTMKELMKLEKELVVCTHGKNGSTALTKDGQWIEETALDGFPMVDANGAGDNYFSGFLYAFLRGESVQNSMKYGSLCGAFCITSKQLVYDGLSAAFIEKEFRKTY